jgi:hypothetical protein
MYMYLMLAIKTRLYQGCISIYEEEGDILGNLRLVAGATRNLHFPSRDMTCDSCQRLHNLGLRAAKLQYQQLSDFHRPSSKFLFLLSTCLSNPIEGPRSPTSAYKQCPLRS